jgi:hypothetical protein
LPGKSDYDDGAPSQQVWINLRLIGEDNGQCRHQSIGAPDNYGILTIVPNLITQNLENTLYADQFSGSDIGAQINAAVAALPSSGGIIDCSAFQGSQTVATTIALIL